MKADAQKEDPGGDGVERRREGARSRTSICTQPISSASEGFHDTVECSADENIAL